MKLRLSNLCWPLSERLDPPAIATRALHAAGDWIEGARLSKKSVDARDKSDVHFVLSIDIDLKAGVPAERLRPPRGALLSPVPDLSYVPPVSAPGRLRPVVVGLGPAGLFAGLLLARAGLRPLVLERGAPVEERARSVARFWAEGTLDPDSNVQFGEGGAGAFSDGKLNSGISDPRCRFVLETLYRHGAPEEILYQAKPHIGTDRLPGVVRSIREKILSLGGEVRFHTALEGLLIENGILRGLTANARQIDSQALILAVGHSARDTFERLFAQGVPMQAKSFSIGARIEHAQALIDRAQYGSFAAHPALGAADYRLNVRTRAGRGVYTFCMCPGGQVVAAASEPGGVVTNGMSAFARDGQNANSALLVSVDPCDYGDGHPLSGVAFQRKWEQAAFRAGGASYRAPAQLVGDFLAGRPSKGPGSVVPSYRPGVCFGDLSRCLPDFALLSMREALPLLGRRLRGFDAPDAVLTGVETRSSSPLRIPRGEDCQCAVRGLYPCGEGAGYAGGILSAAVDGLRCAEKVIEGGAV